MLVNTYSGDPDGKKGRNPPLIDLIKAERVQARLRLLVERLQPRCPGIADICVDEVKRCAGCVSNARLNWYLRAAEDAAVAAANTV